MNSVTDGLQSVGKAQAVNRPVAHSVVPVLALANAGRLGIPASVEPKHPGSQVKLLVTLNQCQRIALIHTGIFVAGIRVAVVKARRNGVMIRLAVDARCEAREHQTTPLVLPVYVRIALPEHQAHAR